MAHCQDCNRTVPDWFMITLEHGGVFGGGETRTCKACDRRAPLPEVDETEEQYEARIGTWERKATTARLPTPLEALLQKAEQRGRDYVSHLAARLDAWFMRKAGYGEQREEDKMPFGGGRPDGSGVIDAGFFPDCECGHPASHIVVVNNENGTCDHWKFSCLPCCHDMTGGDYWPIEDIPPLLAQYATSAEQSKRRHRKMKKTLRQAQQNFANACADRKADADENKDIRDAMFDLENRLNNTVIECNGLKHERNELLDHRSKLAADIVLMKLMVKAAGELWMLLDQIAQMARADCERPITNATEFTSKRFSYAHGKPGYDPIAAELIWVTDADTSRN